MYIYIYIYIYPIALLSNRRLFGREDILHHSCQKLLQLLERRDMMFSSSDLRWWNVRRLGGNARLDMADVMARKDDQNMVV